MDGWLKVCALGVSIIKGRRTAKGSYDHPGLEKEGLAYSVAIFMIEIIYYPYPV